MSVLTLSEHTNPILDLSDTGQVLLSRVGSLMRLMQPPYGYEIIGTARLAASRSFSCILTTDVYEL